MLPQVAVMQHARRKLKLVRAPKGQPHLEFVPPSQGGGDFGKSDLRPLVVAYMKEKYKRSFLIDAAMKALEEMDKYDEALYALLNGLFSDKEIDDILTESLAA